MTADHPEYRGLLRDVLGNPHDDAPRLIFADWLEDHGNARQAEFIRAQLRHGKPLTVANLRTGYRKYHLLGRDDFRYFDDGVLLDVESFGVESVTVRRGFVESVTLPSKQFEMFAGEIFVEHPVTEVRLAGLRPFNAGNHRFGWTVDAGDVPDVPWHVGGEVFAKLPPTSDEFRPWTHSRRRWYESEAKAWEALSAACVAYGREAAEAARVAIVKPVKTESQSVTIDLISSG